MFECTSPEELMVLASTVAIAISEDRDVDDLNVLGNFVVAVGSLMLTFAAQKERFKSKQEANKSSENDTSKPSVKEDNNPPEKDTNNDQDLMNADQCGKTWLNNNLQ